LLCGLIIGDTADQPPRRAWSRRVRPRLDTEETDGQAESLKFPIL